MEGFKGVVLGGATDPVGPPRAFWGPGDTYTFLVTGAESGGSMFAMDCILGPGGGPPPHRHLAEDELFHVYEGEVEFTVEAEMHFIRAGCSAFIPKGRARVHERDQLAGTDADRLHTGRHGGLVPRGLHPGQRPLAASSSSHP
jgi:quercetin dioxygenase-like cupin family protein